MKPLLSALCLLSSVLCLAQDFSSPAFVSHTSTLHQSPDEGPPPTDLINEDFEGAGEPSGWSDDSSGNVVDWDYTAAPLDGSQSLFIADPSSGYRYAVVDFTDADEIYCAFRMRQSAFPGVDSDFLYLQNSADASVALLLIKQTTGVLRFEVDVGGTESNTGVALTGGSEFLVKFRYVRGTGSDETLSVWCVADGSGSWGTATTASNGTSTTQLSHLGFFQNAASVNHDLTFDNVIVRTTDIAIGEL